MPLYSKFLKDMLTRKNRYIHQENNVVEGNCSALMWKQSFPSLFWWCQRLKSRIKSQTSFKNQRVVQSTIKIQVKTQEKTQDMQELQEKHQDKYKKIFSKKKDWIAQFVQKNFSLKNLLPEFLLFGNRLPKAQTVL